MDELKRYDWAEVREALEHLEHYMREHEAHAVNGIAALEQVLQDLPENEDMQ